MNKLGSNKPIFLNQVKMQKPGVEKLVQLLRNNASSLKLVDKDNILIIAAKIEKCYSADKESQE